MYTKLCFLVRMVFYVVVVAFPMTLVMNEVNKYWYPNLLLVHPLRFVMFNQ